MINIFQVERTSGFFFSSLEKIEKKIKRSNSSNLSEEERQIKANRSMR